MFLFLLQLQQSERKNRVCVFCSLTPETALDILSYDILILGMLLGEPHGLTLRPEVESRRACGRGVNKSHQLGAQPQLPSVGG